MAANGETMLLLVAVKLPYSCSVRTARKLENGEFMVVADFDWPSSPPHTPAGALKLENGDVILANPPAAAAGDLGAAKGDVMLVLVFPPNLPSGWGVGPAPRGPLESGFLVKGDVICPLAGPHPPSTPG